MEKKYKLLKSLPGAEAGTVLEVKSLGEMFSSGKPFVLYNCDLGENPINKYPDWFEEIKDKKEYTEEDMYEFALWSVQRYGKSFWPPKPVAKDMQAEVHKRSVKRLIKHWLEDKNKNHEQGNYIGV